MIQKCSIWKVFSEFARQPGKHHHVRELAREIKLAPTSVRLHLRELEINKLIKKEKAGIYQAYVANRNNEDFRFYKKISNLIQLKESRIIEELENKTTPDAIILFGSFEKGEDLETSDIDIFLLAKEKKLNLKLYEKKLKRTIQLHFSEDINKLPIELQNNIANGTLLSGFVRWKT